MARPRGSEEGIQTSRTAPAGEVRRASADALSRHTKLGYQLRILILV